MYNVPDSPLDKVENRMLVADQLLASNIAGVASDVM